MALSDFFPRSHKHLQDRPVLEVTNLTQLPHFVDVSFTVHRGEIVGFYGLMGSGRTRLAKAVFGLSRADRGEIRIQGRHPSRSGRLPKLFRTGSRSFPKTDAC